MTAHACHLGSQCGVRCTGGCDERLGCMGLDVALRCDDHACCVDCADPTTCTECLRVIREADDPWLAGLNHVRVRSGLEHLDVFPDAAYDPNCAEYDSIAEDRAIRASDLTDRASDRAAERYYAGRWGA